MIDSFKKIPIDFGQGGLRKSSKGKLIAFSLIDSKRKGLALDLGCREGYWSKRIEALGYEVASIDIEKRYHKCTVMDANKPLPFPDQSFDLVWSSEVIEHLDSPQKIMTELKRILKPGGQIILTTPNSYFWLFKLLSLFGQTPKKLQRSDHKHFFNLSNIKEIFPEAKIYGFFPYFLVKFKITKLIGLLSPTFVIYLKK
jgi:SAM-dependent methyltransferase